MNSHPSYCVQWFCLTLIFSMTVCAVAGFILGMTMTCTRSVAKAIECNVEGVAMFSHLKISILTLHSPQLQFKSVRGLLHSFVCACMFSCAVRESRCSLPILSFKYILWTVAPIYAHTQL